MQVSIGIPFYNAEKTLTDTLRSVFAQTFQDWELLLVDDGSKDSSLSIAQSVRDPRVRVITDGSNHGLAFRLNQIAQIAKGPYLARMDADDLMHPERLQRQVEILNANPRITVVDTTIYAMSVSNEPVGIRSTGPIVADPKVVIRRGLFTHATMLARVEWFRNNPYDASAQFLRAEDHELWCRVCRQNSFMRIQEPLQFYREGVSMLSNPATILKGIRSYRNSWRKYGPQFAGWPRTLLILGRSYVTATTYRIFASVGLQNVLTSLYIRKRNKPLTAQQYQVATETINRILKTPIPGLTEGQLTEK